MRILEDIRLLNDIASSQKGLFTTAQAKQTGIERYTLSRLEKSGNIERLAHGVYRMGGSPSSREEEVFAVWLSLNPTRQPGSPFDSNSPIVMGSTAAWLLELGEIGPTPYEFCTKDRRQTQRPHMRLRKRCVKQQDIMLVSGLPTTTPERTVIDLIDVGEDLSLISNVLCDALSQGKIHDETKLIKEVNKRAPRRGHTTSQSLFEILLKEGGRWSSKMHCSHCGAS
ncbi:type IV toxin-antitoxin system AbiEi family antitoxin domain-containing protein [Collinsella sp. AGMB00827]|uniref:Type IV toxin-antitoxin system AbiEi family antitoxin domain-containing protein n=1 Tax=Collinsella ureilytica TaxID=2869515 RepID=A0ABS7MHR5_9ACTN|nr:type IV toxin-antitoxin system AbiEi family antitoxin domain-containing protein [Collinsella urealyticum]MBY4796899.1 type IV toxin-antitoxin system AbiEi family antitoxin domain-containing protein [Collinsella urealyticum]